MPTAIVAISADNVIGVDGTLPWHYSEDLKRFKRITLGGAIIMGRKTWQSIGCRSLPGRRNIVISRSTVTDIECYNNVESAINACEEPVWIIGGAQIYQAALDLCDGLDITYVPDRVDREDAVRFPEIDLSHWEITSDSIDPEDSRLRHVFMQRY
ncbi:MAG: dihydrofolate reductase [Parasphingorhabdus sp.]|jgi:dihydrofolate reductase